MRSICLGAIVMGWYLSVPAATYYVDSQNGLDSRLGTSEATAWQSLSKVNSVSFAPGDIIRFKCGGSWTGQLNLGRSGTSGQAITYTSYGTGNPPVITNPSGYQIVNVTGSYVVLDGFRLDQARTAPNGNGAGVRTSTGSSQGIFRNLEISNTAEGVWLGGNHHLVTGCHIHDLHMGVNTQGGDDDCGARAIDFSDAYDIEVSYNRILDCIGPSYDYGQDGGAFEIWRASARVKIHHNYVENCAGALEGGGTGEAVSDFSLYYNVIVSCGAPNGYWFGVHTSGTFGVVPSNFTVNNNTIVNCGSTWGAGAWVAMRNNIYYNSSGGGTQSNNYSGDPQFVNPGAGDYHLRAGSPAIDAGAGLGYTLDYDGVTVPQGSAPDIGAYEFTTGSTRTAATPALSPNGGIAANSVSVTLSTATGGAAIHYTTDGSEPTASSTRYTGPFNLTASAQVRALAVKDGMNNSGVAGTVFLISDANTVYLSDVTWVSAASGWGPVEKDKSNNDSLAGDGNTLTLKGAAYSKGLGTHALSEIVYNLNGHYSSLAAAVGIDDEAGANGSVTFEIWADGVKQYDSGLLTGDTPAKLANVNLQGKNTLRLVVTDGGDNINFDHADWAGALLTPAASGIMPPAGRPLCPLSLQQANPITWSALVAMVQQSGFKVYSLAGQPVELCGNNGKGMYLIGKRRQIIGKIIVVE